MAREQKSIKKNTIYNMLKTFSSIIFPLITFPYVSRVLSPVGIGRYNFSSTYVGYFSLIASLGITTYAIRECAAVRDNQEKLDKVSSQIFSINICTMLIAYAALFVSLVFFRKLDSYRNLIIIFSSNILFTIVGADWINSAFEDFRYITLRTFGMQLISLICIFIFVRKPSDVINYALITVLASGGANILNMFYRRRFCRMRFIKDMGWKKHMPPIIMLFVMILAQQIFSSADITMIGLMRSDAEVGLYSTAVKIFNILNQVIASILWVMLPRLSEYFAKKDYENVNSLLSKNLEFMFFIGLPCIVGCIFESKQVLYIVGGMEFLDAAPCLVVLMMALFFSLVGGSFIGNMVMLPAKKEKYFVIACITATIINIILNAIFIPGFGAFAAAITTLIGYVVMFLMLWFYMDKNIRIERLDKIVLMPVIGSALIALWCIIINRLVSSYVISLLISIAGSSLLYILSAHIMHYQIFEDNVQKILQKIKRNK